MIYKSYNFVESYSNADGTQRNSMVLGEIGQIINEEPKAVVNALKHAGVKLPKNVTRKQLGKIIIANKRNRKLSENLAILIVANAGEKSRSRNFLNMTNTGGDDDALTPLKPLSASAGLKGNAKGTGQLAGTEENKGGWLKSIGSIFKKTTNTTSNPSNDPNATSQEKSNWQKFQNWFSKNRDTIGSVAQTTYNSLQNSGAINTSGGTGISNNQPIVDESTWFERNKGLVIVGLVVLLGAAYYFYSKTGKKGK